MEGLGKISRKTLFYSLSRVTIYGDLSSPLNWPYHLSFWFSFIMSNLKRWSEYVLTNI